MYVYFINIKTQQVQVTTFFVFNFYYLIDECPIYALFNETACDLIHQIIKKSKNVKQMCFLQSVGLTSFLIMHFSSIDNKCED